MLVSRLLKWGSSMQAGSLVGGDVRAFSSRVLVAGVERGVLSWSVDRDIVGDFPAQVVASSGVKQATGSIVWAREVDVSDRAVTPFNGASGWLPKPGDPVQILVSDGVSEWTQFTGVIDETDGEVGGSARSSVVDVIDRLNRPFAFDALLRVMPPTTSAAPAYRGVGLTSLYLGDQALRKAGFYATPKTESNPALSVPAQTSMWPDGGTSGTLSLGSSSDGVSSHALNYVAPWGWAVGNFDCSYTPRLANPGTTAVQLTMMAAPDHTGSATFDVYYGASKLRLWINTGRSAVAFLDGVELGRLSLGAETIVTLLIEGGAWTIRRKDGAQVTGSVSMPSAVMTTVQLVGDGGARVAGFQVSHPTTSAQRFASLGHVQSAAVEAGYLTGIVDALPAVDSTCRKVLDEIGAATLAPYWIDELGVLRAVESWHLRRRASMQTVTTLDDVTSLSWANTLLGLRSQVDVKFGLPAVSKSRWPNTTLWQGSGETLESQQVSEEFIEPATDEAWIQMDESLEVAGVDPDKFNSAHGSFGGGVYRDNATGATTSGGAYITTTLSKIKGMTHKLTTVIGALPAGTKALLKTKDLTTYHPDMRGFSLPVIRGFGKVQWTDATVTSSFVGPDTAPALVHDAGPWLSRTDDNTVVQRIADFIGEQVSVPQPTITGLRVTYDPRRQLGDVITLSSPDLLGVTLTVLIVSISNSVDGSYTQTLAVRIISAVTSYTTYEAFNAAGGQLTYEQWNLLEPTTLTYTQFDAQSSEVA